MVVLSRLFRDPVVRSPHHTEQDAARPARRDDRQVRRLVQAFVHGK